MRRGDLHTHERSVRHQHFAVLLAACVPRLAGEPVDPIDNCADLMPDVAEMINEVERQVVPLQPAWDNLSASYRTLREAV